MAADPECLRGGTLMPEFVEFQARRGSVSKQLATLLVEVCARC